MTGTSRVPNTSTQCPTSLQFDTLDPSSSNNQSSNSTSQQQHDTPRAKRFSQKLVDAAKKQPLARTPSTSVSLSPPLESCMGDDDDDDDSIVETDSSCFVSPNRDDQIMNSHFQNLLLSSPLRPEVMMRPLQLDDSQPSTTIPEPNGALTQQRLQDKRPVKHQPASGSLSAKPKRRKLKQQRTTSWRMGADAALDTSKIHHPIEPSRLSSPPYEQQSSTRRSSRLANRKVSYGDNAGINKKPLVVLGVPAGIKTESETTTTVYDVGDHDQQKPPRKIRRRVDTVETRLNQLIYARDTLDLSQHSVLPTPGDKAPSKSPVVVIDDSDDETDGHTNDGQTQLANGIRSENMDILHNQRESYQDENGLCNKVKPEPEDEVVDLSSPQSTTSQHEEDHSQIPAETTMNDDTDMTEIHENGLAQTPPADTVDTQDNNDDDLVMLDDQGPQATQNSADQDTPSLPPLNEGLPPAQTPPTDTVDTQDNNDDDLVMLDDQGPQAIQNSANQDIPSLPPLNEGLPPAQTPPTDTVDTQDNNDDDLVMLDDQGPQATQNYVKQDIPPLPPLNEGLPLAETPPADIVDTQDKHDDDLIMTDDQRSQATRTSANQDIPSLPPLNITNIPSDHDTTSRAIRAPSLTPSPPSATPPELNDPILAPSSCSDNDSTTNQNTTSNDGDRVQPSIPASASAASTSSSLETATSVSRTSGLVTTEDISTNNSHLPSQQAKDMYTFLADDDNTATTTEDLTSKTVTQNNMKATTSPPSAIEKDNTIGSSEGTTLFGRLIGSASHFFLGN